MSFVNFSLKLTEKEHRDLKTFAEVLSSTPHGLGRELLRVGLRALQGHTDQELELKRQKIELEEKRFRFTTELLEAQRKQAKRSHEDARRAPLQAIVAHFHSGEIEQAKEIYAGLEASGHRGGTRGNVRRKLEANAPEILLAIEDGGEP